MARLIAPTGREIHVFGPMVPALLAVGYKDADAEPCPDNDEGDGDGGSDSTGRGSAARQGSGRNRGPAGGSPAKRRGNADSDEAA
ncbi:hypothetical protein GCM10010470_55330 [Saccharopolyspora taberi]|uniref:Uncharacterized protein n=1 Tax=Saccharopolyspora taberi TaxID=60895 RepID=A0ABN3VLM7_9PSEU